MAARPGYLLPTTNIASFSIRKEPSAVTYPCTASLIASHTCTRLSTGNLASMASSCVSTSW